VRRPVVRRTIRRHDRHVERGMIGGVCHFGVLSVFY